VSQATVSLVLNQSRNIKLSDETRQRVIGMAAELGYDRLPAIHAPRNQEAIASGLSSDYRLRSGMKTENGNIVRYFEALKDDQLALVISGDQSTVKRIEVLDSEIETDSGVKIGTPFSDLYQKAFGNCVSAAAEEGVGVECKDKESQQISYLFTGAWSGPEGLMPSDDTLKGWKVSKIIWQQ
jgi:hypothetical protein